LIKKIINYLINKNLEYFQMINKIQTKRLIIKNKIREFQLQKQFNQINIRKIINSYLLNKAQEFNKVDQKHLLTLE